MATNDSDWDPRREEYFDPNNIYRVNTNAVDYVTQNYNQRNELKICKYFMTQSGCRAGKHCLYKHIHASERLYQDEDEQLTKLISRDNSLFPVGCFLVVEVTALQSPDSFYAIPLCGYASFLKPDKFELDSLLNLSFEESPDATKLLELSEEMRIYYSQPTAKTNYETFPAIGSLVAFKDNSIYFRGRVRSFGAMEGTLDIQCLDTGEMYESFPREDAFYLEKRFALTPAIAMHFCLANVQPHKNGWSTKFLKMFEELLLRKTFVAQIINEGLVEDAFEVQLFTLHDNDEINVSEWLQSCHSAVALNDGIQSDRESCVGFESDELVDQNVSRETEQSFHSCDTNGREDEMNCANRTDANWGWEDNIDYDDSDRHISPSYDTALEETVVAPRKPDILDMLRKSTEMTLSDANSSEQSPIESMCHFNAETSNRTSQVLPREPSRSDVEEPKSEHTLTEGVNADVRDTLFRSRTTCNSLEFNVEDDSYPERELNSDDEEWQSDKSEQSQPLSPRNVVHVRTFTPAEHSLVEQTCGSAVAQSNDEPDQVVLLLESNRLQAENEFQPNQKLFDGYLSGFCEENQSCYGREVDMSLETSNHDTVVESTFYSSKSAFKNENTNAAVEDSIEQRTSAVTDASNSYEDSIENVGSVGSPNCLQNGDSNQDDFNNDNEWQSEISQESQSSSTSRRRRRPRKQKVSLVREIRNLANSISQLAISIQQNQSQAH